MMVVMQRGTTLVFMGALAAGVIASCSSDSELFNEQQTVTSTSAGGNGPATGVGGTTNGAGGMMVDACEECTQQGCANFHNGCFDNNDCVDLINCLEGCAINDDGCREDCRTDNKNGIAALSLLQHCQSTICLDECGVDNALDPCGLCTTQQCENEVNDCAGEPDCLALAECRELCANDVACLGACSNMYPNGVDPLSDLGTCQQQMCSGACS